MAPMFGQMVCVNELVQVVVRLRMVGARHVRHFGLGAAVDDEVQAVHHAHAQHDGGHHDQHGMLADERRCLHRFGQQVEAHDGQHDAAGKRQKQADRAVRFAFEQGAHQAAKTGAAHAGRQRHQGDEYEGIHVFSLSSCLAQLAIAAMTCL